MEKGSSDATQEGLLAHRDEVIDKYVHILQRVGIRRQGRVTNGLDLDSLGRRAPRGEGWGLRWHRRGQVIKVMGGWLEGRILQPSVGYVSNSLGDSTEVGGAILPSHWEHEGKSNVGFALARARGKDNPKLGNIVGVHSHAVETIAQISLVQVDLSELGIGQEDFSKHAVKSLAKLHCLPRGQVEGFIVD